MRNKIFIGFAEAEHLTESKPCLFFTKTKTMVIGETFFELAEQQAKNIGPDWREIVTHKLPGKKNVQEGVHEYTLVEIILPTLIRSFKDGMEATLGQ